MKSTLSRALGARLALPMLPRAASPRLVGLCLVAISALACGARPASPRAPGSPHGASGEPSPLAGAVADGSASVVASASPPAASGSAAPQAPASPGPLVARPAKVAFVAELLAHGEGRVLAAAPDGGVFVLGETTWGYSYSDDLFLARLAPNGDEVFFTQGTGRNTRDLRVSGDAVFFSTELVGQVRFAGATVPTVSGATDLFIARTDLSGKLSWGKMIGTPSYDRGAHLAPTPEGGVFVAHGAFTSRKEGPIVFTPAGAQDTLVSRFNADGTKRWTRSYGLPGYDEPNAIVTAPSGDVFVAGTRWRSRDEWSSALASNVCEGYVMRLTPEGEVRWNVGLGGYRGHTMLTGLALATNGDLQVRGRGMWNVEIGALAFEAKTEEDIFVRITPEGTITTARRAPLTDCRIGEPGGTSVAVANSGVFHEDENGKRTAILAFETPGTEVFDCALAGSGRLYLAGRTTPGSTMGGVPVSKPRHVRNGAFLPAYGVGFVAGLDL